MNIYELTFGTGDSHPIFLSKIKIELHIYQKIPLFKRINLYLYN